MEITELQRRESERARHLENRGRLAGVFEAYDTVGSGLVEFPKRLDFGLVFTEEPFAAWGHKVDPDDLRDFLELEDGADVPYAPQATGYVTEWDRDEKGNYVGCWLAISVTLPDAYETTAPVKMRHYLQLWAIALKDIPIPADQDDGPK